MSGTPKDLIECYLRTGEYDPHFAAWPGSFLTRARQATDELKAALLAAVEARTVGAACPSSLAGPDPVALTREKVAPMVRGLFPRREQAAVLGVLERAVVFLTPDTIAAVLREARWLGTAWRLANLYLVSVGWDPLAPDAPAIVGLSEETTCYVSAEYFRVSGRFEDFVVHEAAHVFHNCRRATVGLPETRARRWLLAIAFPKRETFAYACEAYSRLLALAGDRAGRGALLAELAAEAPLPDERVDPAEYLDILRDAVEARNAWQRILARCAPPAPTLHRTPTG